MKIEENYIEKLCNTVAKTLVEAFERLTIDDVNMYQLGYNKAIDDFADKIINLCDDREFMNQFNEFPATTILEIAEQLREGVEDGNNE